MDYIQGETAEAIYNRSADLATPLPLDFALTVVVAIASALGYAHTLTGADGAPLEIVHRDVSLSNIMCGFEGAVKLIDFGIAKSANRATRTQAGTLKGKFGYLAPEQIVRGPVDHRADLFALGVVLYELTTMSRAFIASSELLTLERIMKGDVKPPSKLNADYPARARADRHEGARGRSEAPLSRRARDRARPSRRSRRRPASGCATRRSSTRSASCSIALRGGGVDSRSAPTGCRKFPRRSSKCRRGRSRCWRSPSRWTKQELTTPVPSVVVSPRVSFTPRPSTRMPTVTAEIVVAPTHAVGRWTGFWVAIGLLAIAVGIAVALGLT